MKYLAIITQTATGFSGTVHDLPVMATAKTLEALEQDLSEGLALWLDEATPPTKIAQKLSDLPADIQAAYEGQSPTELLIEPAPMNPVSLEVERAIEASGLSYRELARRMGTGHASLSRLANPFYWGHSLPMLRRLAEELGLHIELKLTA
ncbi:type II toxin-antitoxin system HicB family antitoxin [Deinococcus lacus]|uniref:Type II toxin-antitoxin system HicB family antitoxin n=1 Tax=Deinococcus lacus TaxID=392561 RepID=A0ABW1YFQ6_9DEIO